METKLRTLRPAAAKTAEAEEEEEEEEEGEASSSCSRQSSRCDVLVSAKVMTMRPNDKALSAS